MNLTKFFVRYSESLFDERFLLLLNLILLVFNQGFIVCGQFVRNKRDSVEVFAHWLSFFIEVVPRRILDP